MKNYQKIWAGPSQPSHLEKIQKNSTFFSGDLPSGRRRNFSFWLINGGSVNTLKYNIMSHKFTHVNVVSQWQGRWQCHCNEVTQHHRPVNDRIAHLVTLSRTGFLLTLLPQSTPHLSFSLLFPFTKVSSPLLNLLPLPPLPLHVPHYRVISSQQGTTGTSLTTSLRTF